MIANFFHGLDRCSVQYLLISGQASVLYGAATFSEDIDLWVNPTRESCVGLMAVLRDCGAHYYKLTPQLTVEHLVRGHGFHFLVPVGEGEPAVFLDIVGRPPRVGSFAIAADAARWMDTEWGPLHTIGLKDLVELKKTQRLEDYSVISNLALAWFDLPDCHQAPDDFRWAMENIFTLPALRTFFEEHPAAISLVSGELAAGLRTFGEEVLAGREAPEVVVGQLNAWMQHRMTMLQQADRRYWRDIIAELKQLRTAGRLMPEGAEV